MNKKFSKPIRLFLEDMLTVSFTKDFPGFFYKSRAHVMVVLLITKSTIDNDDIGFEEICEIIPKSISSRSTIKTILDQGTKLKYFEKVNSTKDKRKKIYNPTVSTKLFMQKWIYRNYEIFKKVKN